MEKSLVSTLALGTVCLLLVCQVSPLRADSAAGCSFQSQSTDAQAQPSPCAAAGPSPDPPATGSVAILAGIGLGIGVPMLLIVGVVCSLSLFVCVKLAKSQGPGADSQQPTRSSTRRGTAVADSFLDQEMYSSGLGAAFPGTGSDCNLMMEDSVVHSALFDINLSPRSATVAKRIGTVEFLSLSPKQRLQQLEFPHGNICILKELGELTFGKVYQGEATGIKENELSTTVYIKSLRERASVSMKSQFIVEMTWASSISHPNILTLLGICNKEYPKYMIYEFLEYGSLKSFLRSIDSAWFDFDEALNDAASTCASSSTPVLNVEDLLSIGSQVASGMDYLANKALLHKDLAARNCYVGSRVTVKIANFGGLSRDLSCSDYCQVQVHSSSQTLLPLRWLAPETVRNSKYSLYTDVWSFGVLLWEVFSFGALPYSELDNARATQMILDLTILTQPKNCPENVYKIMKSCWNRSPRKRPHFNTLYGTLNKAVKELDAHDQRRPLQAHALKSIISKN